MKNIIFLCAVCLVGQIALSGCTNKEVVPSIDSIVGEYDCKFALDGFEKSGYFRKIEIFTVRKSMSKANAVEIDIEYYAGGRVPQNYKKEFWIMDYYEGSLFMSDREVGRILLTPTNNPMFPPYAVVFQRATGKAFGDSLHLDSIQSLERDGGRTFGSTAQRFWAKKR